jgi:hypothetical protein
VSGAPEKFIDKHGVFDIYSILLGEWNTKKYFPLDSFNPEQTVETARYV